MSKRLTGLKLDVPADEAVEACRRAAARLEWELTEIGSGRFLIREDAAKLACCDWPAEIELEVDPLREEQAAITIAGSVPGLGPLSSRHLRGSLSALEHAIQRSLR